MTLSASCPACGSALQLTNHGTFDSWICPNGHGLAATLSELYERAQEDEIHQLWRLAKTAPQGDRPCPMCARHMVKVTAPYDGDEAEEGAVGDGPAVGEIPVDVCSADQVIWFDTAELDALPADLPDPEPTPAQEAALAAAIEHFGDEYEAAGESRPDLADRILARLGHSSRAFRLLGERQPQP